MAKSELEEYIRSNKCEGFSPHTDFDSGSDTLAIYVSNEESYADRVDEFLTAYLSLDGKRLTGVEFKGVSHLLDTIGSFGIAYENVELNVSVICMAFLVTQPTLEEAWRRRITEMSRTISETQPRIRFDSDQLVAH